MKIHNFLKIAKKLILNKYGLLVSISIIYILSWWSCIGDTNKKVVIFTQKEVQTYNYIDCGNSIAQKLEFNDKNRKKIVKSIHIIYYPVEIITNIFGYKFIRDFYQSNTKNLIDFNLSSEADKLRFYNKIMDYHDCILQGDDLTAFFLANDKEGEKYKIPYKLKSYSFEVFDLGGRFLKEDEFYDDTRPTNGFENFYYTYSEYVMVMTESKKFTKWFNNINITTNNPNFDKEFVEKFRTFIKEQEEKEASPNPK